jgi:hypothetical protein
MTDISLPLRLLIINIDGLRQDVFHQALAAGRIPNLARLLGITGSADGCHMNPVSTAPSITFCAQSSIFTGQHPDQHGIPGNQFFDRFGLRTGKPRFYAFDVGDTLAYDDAVLTFTGPLGLVGQTMAPETPTLYERARSRGLTATVVYHMVNRGASTWIRPNLLDIARLTKGGGLFGLSAEAYDRQMMDQAIKHLRSEGAVDILTVYFMGLDHVSHHDGPGAQMDYLSRVVDVEIGRLTGVMQKCNLYQGTLVGVISDHGHVAVIPDDRHSLRLSFPFDREMGYLFDALGLDVHDKPGEGPACDAVVASNGGIAHVYLRRRIGLWSDLPNFEDEVLHVARAFWQAHTSGRYAPDLHGALAMVLARDAEHRGWEADYQAVTPDGNLVCIEEFLEARPEIKTIDAVPRLRHLAGPLSGDLLLVSNYAEGFYFGGITTGVHGGLHPDDSLAVASFGWVGASSEQQAYLQKIMEETVTQRRAEDGRTLANIVDFAPVLERVMGWSQEN